MRIAIFSDIHENKEALKSIIDDINNNNIDEIICLGDTIGIGPNPKECMDMIIGNIPCMRCIENNQLIQYSIPQEYYIEFMTYINIIANKFIVSAKKINANSNFDDLQINLIQ